MAGEEGGGPWKNKRDGMRTAYACAGGQGCRQGGGCLSAWAMEEQHALKLQSGRVDAPRQVGDPGSADGAGFS